MKGNVIHIDEKQIQLINLIDEWLRDLMRDNKTSNQEIGVIANARVFLQEILSKGWYREESEEQRLLTDLRKDWIKSGGKWKAK
jgi:hypothetical protein